MTLEKSSRRKSQINRSPRKVKTKSNKNRAIFLLRQVSSRDALLILDSLSKGNSQKKVADQTSFSKQKVFYWKQIFLANKLIRLEIDGKPKIYRVTALGQKTLTRGEKGGFNHCIMEDYQMKFRLIKDSSRLDWKKLGEPRNWEKLGIKVGKVRVEKTTQNIIIHSGQVVGVHPSHAMIEAGSIIGVVFGFLKSHGVVMDPVGLPSRQPIFKFYTPEAEELYRLYGVTITDKGTIDNSPPDKIPHEEYPRNAAVDKLTMPSRVVRMEDRQVKIEERLKNIEAVEDRIVTALEKLADGFERLTTNLVQKKKTSKAPPDKSGMVV